MLWKQHYYYLLWIFFMPGLHFSNDNFGWFYNFIKYISLFFISVNILWIFSVCPRNKYKCIPPPILYINSELTLSLLPLFLLEHPPFSYKLPELLLVELFSAPVTSAHGALDFPSWGKYTIVRLFLELVAKFFQLFT